MDFGAFAQSIAQQFVTVWNAPVPFLAALIASWFLIRWFIKSQFETRLANGQSTIDMLEKRLDRMETSDAMAMATATQSRELEIQPTPASTSDLRPAPTKLNVDGPKEFVRDDITADQLHGMFKERTELQAKLMTNDQIGKWIRVSGKVVGVNAAMDEKFVLVGIAVGERGLVFLEFPPEFDGLERLNMGDAIEAEGRIQEISNLGLSLTESSLL